MEVKATLEKPYTQGQKINFIIRYNRELNYKIEERQDCLVALWYTEEELEEIEKQNKMDEIDRKIEELNQLSLTQLRLNNESSVECINEIIKGLYQTKTELMSIS